VESVDASAFNAWRFTEDRLTGSIQSLSYAIWRSRTRASYSEVATSTPSLSAHGIKGAEPLGPPLRRAPSRTWSHWCRPGNSFSRSSNVEISHGSRLAARGDPVEEVTGSPVPPLVQSCRQRQRHLDLLRWSHGLHLHSSLPRTLWPPLTGALRHVLRILHLENPADGLDPRTCRRLLLRWRDD
jgi:hypothetical protein